MTVPPYMVRANGRDLSFVTMRSQPVTHTRQQCRCPRCTQEVQPDARQTHLHPGTRQECLRLPPCNCGPLRCVRACRLLVQLHVNPFSHPPPALHTRVRVRAPSPPFSSPVGGRGPRRRLSPPCRNPPSTHALASSCQPTSPHPHLGPHPAPHRRPLPTRPPTACAPPTILPTRCSPHVPTPDAGDNYLARAFTRSWSPLMTLNTAPFPGAYAPTRTSPRTHGRLFLQCACHARVTVNLT